MCVSLLRVDRPALSAQLSLKLFTCLCCLAARLQAAEQGGEHGFLASAAVGILDAQWQTCNARSAAELARRGLPARLQRFDAGGGVPALLAAARTGDVLLEGEVMMRMSLVSQWQACHTRRRKGSCKSVPSNCLAT